MIEQGRVQAVLNCYSRFDLWARLVGWVVKDAGPSGAGGFDAETASRVVQQKYNEFGHSDYFYRAHYDKSWVPFLIDGRVVMGAQNSFPKERNWRFTATLLGVVVLVGLLIWNVA
jgi:hypothetical protein